MRAARALLAVTFVFSVGEPARAWAAPGAPAKATPPTATATPTGQPMGGDPHAGMAPGAHPGGGDPHAGMARGRDDGAIAKPVPNQVLVDESLPAGTIDVRIVDAFERPVANAPVGLAVVHNTVAEGESRTREEHTTDGDGRLRLEGRALGSGISYRVSTHRGEAEFASDPFGLRDKGGVRVILHAYEPTSELANAAWVVEAFVVLDVKQDTIRVSHLLRTLNVGRTAFVVRGLRIPLPEGARAFSQEESMAGGKLIEKDGALELFGTFPPGQMEMTYAYTVPLGSESAQSVRIGLPPRAVQTTVMSSAGPTMNLEVAGFPEAERGRRRDGQKVLETSKQADLSRGIEGVLADVAPAQLEVTLSGLPSMGYGPKVAAALAVVLAALGVLSLGRGKNREANDELAEELEEARDRLLDELVRLEKARTKGDVGPKSYERLRVAMLDSLARIVSRLEGARAMGSRTVEART